MGQGLECVPWHQCLVRARINLGRRPSRIPHVCRPSPRGRTRSPPAARPPRLLIAADRSARRMIMLPQRVQVLVVMPDKWRGCRHPECSPWAKSQSCLFPRSPGGRSQRHRRWRLRRLVDQHPLLVEPLLSPGGRRWSPLSGLVSARRSAWRTDSRWAGMGRALGSR
jgi:hypothetical protein